jgi:hypothetical protein
MKERTFKQATILCRRNDVGLDWVVADPKADKWTRKRLNS